MKERPKHRRRRRTYVVYAANYEPWVGPAPWEFRTFRRASHHALRLGEGVTISEWIEPVGFPRHPLSYSWIARDLIVRHGRIVRMLDPVNTWFERTHERARKLDQKYSMKEKDNP